MTFLALSPLLQGFLLLWMTLTVSLLAYVLLRTIQLRRRRKSILAVSALLLVTMLALQIMLQHRENDWLIPWQPPLWCLLALAFGLMFGAVLLLLQTVRWDKRHISAMSIKEAFDRLPTGLCCYLPGGQPILINNKMQEICTACTASPLLNAESFWSALKNGEVPYTIRAGTQPLLELSDHSIISFQQNTLVFSDATVTELIAVDVTEEYRLTQTLEEKQERAKQNNTRLKSLLSTVEYVTMSRELLQIKTALHDNIGQSLLLARRYLEKPEAVDREELLRLWRRNLRHLKNEEQENWQIPYYVIRRQAAALGIALQVKGRLPDEDRLIPTVDAAISTHVTNVLRHAKGTTAQITSERTQAGWVLLLTNDGIPPAAPIEETGGLANLRRQVESLGGTMQIRSQPTFSLQIELPI